MREKSLTQSDVFERVGEDLISARAFYLLLGGVLVYGLGATAWVASKMAAIHYQPTLFEMIGVGLVVPLIGILIASTGGAILSFIGYNLVLVPFGVILAPLVNHYNTLSPALIGNAFAITCGVTAVMMVAGMLLPDVFESLGGALFVSLCGLLVVRIAQIFIPSLAAMGVFDWIGAGIFSLYIGYDFQRASRIPKTMGNVVGVALSLYLDMVNLFITILRIFGKK